MQSSESLVLVSFIIYSSQVFNIRDEEHLGLPSVVAGRLKARTEDKTQGHKHFTILIDCTHSCWILIRKSAVYQLLWKFYFGVNPWFVLCQIRFSAVGAGWTNFSLNRLSKPIINLVSQNCLEMCIVELLIMWIFKYSLTDWSVMVKVVVYETKLKSLWWLQTYPDEGHNFDGVQEHLYRAMEAFWDECFGPTDFIEWETGSSIFSFRQ